jgi:aryl-phospho-beta-D-glucosidase BglC (GH1 family)
VGRQILRFPAQPLCTAAQFGNKDRIKIHTETVQRPTTSTNQIASESPRHTAARSVVQIRTRLFHTRPGWNLNGHKRSATRIADDGEAGLRAVKNFKALADVLHPDTSSGAADRC